MHKCAGHVKQEAEKFCYQKMTEDPGSTIRNINKKLPTLPTQDLLPIILKTPHFSKTDYDSCNSLERKTVLITSRSVLQHLSTNLTKTTGSREGQVRTLSVNKCFPQTITLLSNFCNGLYISSEDQVLGVY